MSLLAILKFTLPYALVLVGSLLAAVVWFAPSRGVRRLPEIPENGVRKRRAF